MRVVNIEAHLLQMIPDDVQPFRPMRYAGSAKAKFKMLRKSWAG